MEISYNDWNKYRKLLKGICDAAESDFWKGAQALARYHGTVGVLSVPRGEIIELASALVQKYGEASAEAACLMHELMADMAGVAIPAAEPAAIMDIHEVAKVINGAAKSGNDEVVAGSVGRMVKQAGQDTTYKNAVRDHAQMAWVPVGETCAFCLVLASNGWQYASAAQVKGNHVSHIHENCDCAYAVRFSEDQTVGGYYPAKYKSMYDRQPGGNAKQRLNGLRREIYYENEEKINAQKRDAYQKRKERESSQAEEANV